MIATGVERRRSLTAVPVSLQLRRHHRGVRHSTLDWPHRHATRDCKVVCLPSPVQLSVSSPASLAPASLTSAEMPSTTRPHALPPNPSMLVPALLLLLLCSLPSPSPAAALSSRPASLTSAEDVSADCHLRAFAVDFARWLQPPHPTTDWPGAVHSAFEMPSLCPNHSSPSPTPTHHPPHPPLDTRGRAAAKTAAQLIDACQASVHVDGARGNDSYPGSLHLPLRSIAVGLRLTRSLRLQRGLTSLCLVLRRATYHLGREWSTPAFPSSERSSRVGAIALTAADGGLTMTAFPGEEGQVVLSGGVLLDQLQWALYRRTPAGDVLQARLPPGLDLDFRAANELYADSRRLPRARFPDADPSTQGLWTEPTGWVPGAERWLPPRSHPPVVDVVVATPERNGTFFPNFHSGVGGRCAVFDPPMGYWCSDAPPAGGPFTLPSGMVDRTYLRARMANWTHPETGFVHAMHGASWGSWVFAIAGVDADAGAVTFGTGGTQEGRGAANGAEYYVDHLLEELDAPGEWFLDAATATLYLMPNRSLPAELVLSQLPCVLSVVGSRAQPVEGVTVHGVVITQTANTFMRLHEMPSGGDFSLHRGASVFVTGTAGFSLTGSTLTQLGSNGVTVSDWNVNATVEGNEVSFLGGSGVQVVGSSWSIDGVSNLAQPRGTHVRSNLVHDVGIYVKQSAGVVQAVARRTHVEGNALFNAPRMLTCWNDGFAGGNVLAHNLGFNAMRETGDAGVFESWDRQPYLTEEGGQGPSLTPAWSEEHHNVAYVNYRADATINHDDGSAWYEDHHNVLIYLGYQTYLGHSKHYHHELVLYPDVVDGRPCFETNQSPGGLQFDEVYTGNRCVQRRSGQAYGIRACRVESLVADVGLAIDRTTFYYPEAAQPYFPCAQAGQLRNLSLDEWTAATGLDAHSGVEVTPPIETLVTWARQLLMNDTNDTDAHSRRRRVVDREDSGWDID